MIERESPTQDALLEFVRDYKQSNEAGGNLPTYEEIAEALRITRTTAYNTVLKLIKRGKLSVNNKGKIKLGGKYIPPE